MTPVPAPSPPAQAGLVLLPLARQAIARRLGVPCPAPPPAGADAAWLQEDGASFVTLTLDGALRGCIGSLRAYRPLRADVEDNAVAAATRDPRFPTLTAVELGAVCLEVSVLSAPAPLEAGSQAELLARLRPGVDGVVLSASGHHATFLPQVWSDLPDPARFLELLRRKAGLPPGYWGPDVVVETYTVTAWKEAAPGAGTPGPEGQPGPGGRPGPGGQPEPGGQSGTSVDGAP